MRKILLVFTLFAFIDSNAQPQAIPPADFDRIIATVDYTGVGCFSGHATKLLIKRKNKSFFAELISGDTIRQVAWLDKSQLDYFNYFVNALRDLKIGQCNYTGYYKVAYNNEYIKKEDNNCTWDGFGRLTRHFFKNM